MASNLTRRSLMASGSVAAAGIAGRPDRAVAAPALPGQQVPGYYRYRVGDLVVTSVTDGVNQFPVPEGFVLNASRNDVGGALKAAYLDGQTIAVPYTPISVHTASRLVVIDTGTGEGNLAASRGAAGQFMANLKASGVDPQDVDTVIISHFHGDHVNGLLTPDGQPAFPKAEIMVPRVEWAFWMDDGEMSRASKGRMEGQFKNNRRVFDALSRRVTPYDWDREVVAGILAVGTPGHTPGHTSYVLASGGHSVFVQSDVTNVPVLFARHPGWHVAYDQDPAQAEATRRRVYDMLAADRVKVQGFHYPFPACAHVEKTADGYREVPVPWSPVV